MKESVGYIIENSNGEVLLMLRDNKKGIPFPNMWYIPGGGIEKEETPLVAVKREIKEELGIIINNLRLIKTFKWPDKIDYIFYTKLNLDLNKINITEGQKIAFFTKKLILKMDLAFYDNKIASDCFNEGVLT